MPLLATDYNPPRLFRNGHLATIYSGLFRRIPGLDYRRERLELPDGDFLDLDWSFAPKQASSAIILLHGLEGDAKRPYMAWSAKHLNASGHDVCAVNFRGCSGVPNRLFRSYHSGATEDLHAVVQHIVESNKYNSLFIKGFSLGGNMCLKYLGESRKLPDMLKAAIAISVPCELHSSLVELLSAKNWMYARRFRRHLVAKLRIKAAQFPERIGMPDIRRVITLKDFDDIYTSRAHGFEDALDYYRQCSSSQFLANIPIPTLLINARNDSFLGPECYPVQEAEQNKNLFLEMPRFGGHVGFFEPGNNYYTEKRAIKFLEEQA